MRRSPACRIGCTTRSRRTRRSAIVRRAARARGAGPTPTLAASSRSRCASASRRPTSSSPASARRATSWQRAIALGVGAINAESFGEIDRIVGPAPAPPGRRRASPSASIPTWTPAAIRTFRRAHERRSSACRSASCATMIHGIGRHANLRARRPARARRIADHDRSTRWRVPPRRSPTWRATLVGAAALPLEHLDLGGGLGIPYQPGQSVVSPAEYAAALLPAVRRTGLMLAARARPMDRRAQSACCSRPSSI